MEFYEVLETRRSERHFSDEPLPRERVEALIASACHAPSAGNRQPWRVVALAPAAARRLIDELEPRAWEILYPTLREVIANSPEVLGRAVSERELARATVAFVRDNIFLRGAPWLLVTYLERPSALARGKVVAATAQMLRQRLAAQPSLGAKVELAAFVAGSAPVAMRTDARADLASVAGFMYGLTLAARAEGMASCIQLTWALVADTLRQRLGLPRRAEILGAVALGWPDPDRDLGLQRRVADRKPVAVTWVDDEGRQSEAAVTPR